MKSPPRVTLPHGHETRLKGVDRERVAQGHEGSPQGELRSESGKDGPWKELDSRERHGHGTIH